MIFLQEIAQPEVPAGMSPALQYFLFGLQIILLIVIALRKFKFPKERFESMEAKISTMNTIIEGLKAFSDKEVFAQYKARKKLHQETIKELKEAQNLIVELKNKLEDYKDDEKKVELEEAINAASVLTGSLAQKIEAWEEMSEGQGPIGLSHYSSGSTDENGPPPPSGSK